MNGEVEVKLAKIVGGYLLSFALLLLGYCLIIHGIVWDGRMLYCFGCVLILILIFQDLIFKKFKN